MKSTNVVPNLLFVMALPLISLLSACSDAPNRLTPVDGNFFPFDESRAQFYLREQHVPGTNEPYFVDTIKVLFKGDTLIGEKTFKQFRFYDRWETADHTFIEQSDVFRIVSQRGSKYYRLPFSSDTTQFLFLDTKAMKGAQQVYFSGFENENKSVVTIKEVDATKILFGERYFHVIEVWNEVYYKNQNEWVLNVLEKKYYAKGIGEIYSSTETYSYPTGLTFTLLNFN